MPRRELLLVAEMLDATRQIQDLVRGHDSTAIAADRVRRDALEDD